MLVDDSKPDGAKYEITANVCTSYGVARFEIFSHFKGTVLQKVRRLTFHPAPSFSRPPTRSPTSLHSLSRPQGLDVVLYLRGDHRHLLLHLQGLSPPEPPRAL